MSDQCWATYMSDSIALDVQDRETVDYGVQSFADNWCLKIVTITAADVAAAPLGTTRRVLADLLPTITARMSPEFAYGRFGLAVLHTGRRGVCVTITHFGSWGPTFEVFSTAWYRYGYGFDGFELLSDIEPSYCLFEVKLTVAEILRVCGLIGGRSLQEVRRAYLRELQKRSPQSPSAESS